LSPVSRLQQVIENLEQRRLGAVKFSVRPVAVLGKNIWGGLAPHHLGGNHG